MATNIPTGAIPRYRRAGNRGMVRDDVTGSWYRYADVDARLTAQAHERAELIDQTYRLGAEAADQRLRAERAESICAAQVQEIERLRDRWQPIETLPSQDIRAFFWVVPKSPEETFRDTSGRPIMSDHAPYRMEGKWRSWGSLLKATHWMPLPDPPTALHTEAPDGK
jgi:hypothetical protein